MSSGEPKHTTQTFKEKVPRTPAWQVMREVFSGNIPGDDAVVKTKSRYATASNREFMLCCCILALVAPAPTHLVAPAQTPGVKLLLDFNV